MTELTEYWGEEAQRIAATLKQIGKDDSKWHVYYEDPKSGEQWVMDYPQSELHAGGSPRLRRCPDQPSDKPARR
jgi:hypothetical protein